MSGPQILGISSTLALLAYSGFVEVKNRANKARQKPSDEERKGSLEMQIIENFQTGDLVVFNRKWYNYHIPVAGGILLRQYMNNSEFDHVGLIINNKFGEPYIFEMTPFKGTIC